MFARAIACGVVLGASTALAGWVPVTVNGAPRDVSIEADGVITMATTNEAVVKVCVDGGTCTNAAVPAPLAGSFETATAQLDAGCILAVVAGSAAMAGCQTGNVTTSNRAPRVRHSESGFTGVWAWGGGSSGRTFTATNPSSTFMLNTHMSGLPPLPTVSALRHLGSEYVVFSTNTPAVRLFTPMSAGLVDVSTAPVVSTAEAQLFVRRDGGLGLVVAEAPPAAGLILIGSLFADGGFDRVSARNTNGNMLSLSYVEQNGSRLGAGFGMAALFDGGVIGPVPDPSAPGELWVMRGGPGAAVSQVACSSPRFCTAISTTPAAAWVYWNEAPPTAGFGPAGTVTAGVPLDIGVTFTDPDGDPVAVTWELDAGALAVTPSPDAGSVRVVAGQCGAYDLTVRVSDGWAPHDTSYTVPVPVTVGLPDPPLVMPLTAMARAGEQDVTFTATLADAGCPASSIAWRLASGPGTLNGGTYTPPATVCSANGVDAVIEARALGNPDASVPVSAMVHVDPWGYPSTPNITGGTQPAGTDASYPLVGSRHACEDAGAPLVVSWVLDGGGAGVTWATSVGGLTVFSTDLCSDGGVSGTVTYSVAGQSRTAPVSVEVEPVATAPTGFSLGYMFSGGLAEGTYSVTGAGCVSPGRFTAGVVANDLSTGARVGESPPQDIALDPTWELGLQNSCNGGSFEIIGTLYGGPMPPLTERHTETFGRFAAGITADDTVLDVTCAGGVNGEVRVAPADGGCRVQDYTWEQLTGPELVADARDAGAIRVQSVETGFELIGETIRWRVTATAGAGNTAERELAVRLSHRFIALTHSVGPQGAGADDLQAVTVRVRNTEACGASAIELDEVPTGLSPIAASARVDGSVVAATVLADGHFVIGPFAVEASQERVVTYLARVPMFSRAAPGGVAMMKGEEVSLGAPVPLPVAAGCGCTSTPPGLLLAALSAALWRRRSRSSPRL
ncbi:MAG: hypothetical protein JNK82_10905 [Myxococcaceae bacterium]|nr:hypothetical protein [Myxococcaceae bacterium]